MKKNDEKFKEKCERLRYRIDNYYSLDPIKQAMLIGEVLALLDDLIGE